MMRCNEPAWWFPAVSALVTVLCGVANGMDKPKTLLLIQPTKQYPRYGEGSLVELKDGRLFLCYTRFERGSHDNSLADIVARTSKDNGATWGRTRVLVGRDEAKENVMSASILRLKSGDLLLLYVRKNGWGDCNAYVRRSTDEFKTLGEPVCVTGTKGYHVVNNDRAVQLSTGRIVVPAALHPCRDGTRKTWTPYGRPRVFVSDDNGKTWRLAGLVPTPKRKVMLQEPGIVERKNGRLRMWMRTDAGCQYESVSDDAGHTWTTPKPGKIQSPLSPASIRRVPWTGDLMLVWNDHSGDHSYPKDQPRYRDRSPVCAAISTDDGKTWRKSRVIENDLSGCFAYFSITFLDDRALVGYFSKKKGATRFALKVVSLPRRWLYATPSAP